MSNLPTTAASTAAPDLSTIEKPVTIACPSWCVNDHDVVGPCLAEGVDGNWVTTHDGPTWGTLRAGADVSLETGRVEISVDLDPDATVIDGTSDPLVLRQLAGDALAAAEWLEEALR